ncbi:MAG: hypothetical protein H0X17_09710 [Deltaproteobacteria bacterium]|nr:hypothetical protein [Deltaproteobacteria bacterium]
MHQHWLAILVLGACSGPPQAAPDTAPVAPVAPVAPETSEAAGAVAIPAPDPGEARSADSDVEDVATRLGHAVFTNDRAAYLALTLPYADVAKLLVDPRDQPRWDAQIAEFFDKLAREVREARQAGAPPRVVGARTLRTKRLTPDEDRKVTRAIDTAIVQLEIERRGERRAAGIPLIFLRTDAGWRFSPVQ